MLCDNGVVSLSEYRQAAEVRADARDSLLLASGCQEFREEFLFAAEQMYSRTFVAWVTHRGACVECRAASLANDRAQFASV